MTKEANRNIPSETNFMSPMNNPILFNPDHLDFAAVFYVVEAPAARFWLFWTGLLRLHASLSSSNWKRRWSSASISSEMVHRFASKWPSTLPSAEICEVNRLPRRFSP
jgi:hypothetical protein